MATLLLNRIDRRLNSILRGKGRFVDDTDDLKEECPFFIHIFYYVGGSMMHNERHRFIHYNGDYTKCVILTYTSGAKPHVKDCTSEPAAVRAFIERFNTRDAALGDYVIHNNNTYTFQGVSIEFSDQEPGSECRDQK